MDYSAEVKAMGTIDTALEEIDDAARSRVIRWVIEKYSLDIYRSSNSFEDTTLRNLTDPSSREQTDAINIFEYEEEESEGKLSRRVRSKFTDETGKNIGTPIARAIERRTSFVEEELPIGLPQGKVQNSEGRPKVGDGPQVQDKKRETREVDDASFRDVETGEGESDQVKLQRVFRSRDDRFELDNPHIKATSQRDFVRRVTRLFLYVHWLNGNREVERSKITELWKAWSVEDSNARNWLSKYPGVEVREDKVILNLVGRKEAQQDLEDVFNSEKQDEWTVKSASQSKSKKKTKSKEKTGKKGGTGKRSKISARDKEEWVRKWKEQNSGVDGHAILSSRQSAEKGLFALWAIRDVAEEAVRVVSAGDIVKFLYEAFELKVDRRNLARALEKKEMKDFVIKVAGGYQINPAGVRKAKVMLSSSTESQ